MGEGERALGEVLAGVTPREGHQLTHLTELLPVVGVRVRERGCPHVAMP